METLKKPETVITLINTSALLGASVYFYRRINGLEQELDLIKDHVTSTVKKVKELQVTKQHVRQLAAAIRELNTIMGTQKNELANIKGISEFQKEQIVELQNQSRELGGECKLINSPYQRQYQQFSPQPRQAQNNFNVPQNVPQGFQQPNFSHQQSNNIVQPALPNNQRQNFPQNNQGFQQQQNQVPNYQQNNQGFNMQQNQQAGFQPQSPNTPQIGQYNNSPPPQHNSNSLFDGLSTPALGGFNSQNNSLISLSDVNLDRPEMIEDDLDSEIDAVRRARNNNAVNTNSLGL